jgi:hypothetical protein
MGEVLGWSEERRGWEVERYGRMTGGLAVGWEGVGAGVGTRMEDGGWKMEGRGGVGENGATGGGVASGVSA